jgi:asparagine synthase (glutamine-hydrolysing)
VCGIAGVMARRKGVEPYLERLDRATDRLHARGPDFSDRFVAGGVALGHRRLAIIDTTAAGNQPMTDDTGRYTIVYNGEVYNYRDLRRRLQQEGVRFVSQSDSEVMLKLFIARGPSALDEVNGFFAFAVFDRDRGSLFLARDRLGIKPLYYYEDDEVFLFGSELKSILAFDVPKEIDEISLFQYLQVNYVPAPHTILRGVKKLEPGCCIETNGDETRVHRYYKVAIRSGSTESPRSYDDAVERVRSLLDDAVRLRLVADVPLGAFLSGGLDSTVIAALAARHVSRLQTFSIGYADEAFFDETPDAFAAARTIGTDHTVFRLTSRDLYDHLYEALDYFGEPFSDPSALAVIILSRRTREHVKVALTGDGADELLGGYNKHYAEYRARRGGASVALVKALSPLWNALPVSRDSTVANKIRQLRRFARASRMSAAGRYWHWCSSTTESDARRVLGTAAGGGFFDEYRRRVGEAVGNIRDDGGMNDVFLADVRLVLPNNMLHKVDSMSMASSLEVRVPYLDHRFVELCFSLPSDYKIAGGTRKRILRDAFAPVVPERVLRKPKHGFDVPLMKWFRTDLRPLIADELLADDFVAAQGVFEAGAIRSLKRRLFSSRPGDIAPLVWSLIVFQYWWKKYMK